MDSPARLVVVPVAADGALAMAWALAVVGAAICAATTLGGDIAAVLVCGAARERSARWGKRAREVREQGGRWSLIDTDGVLHTDATARVRVSHPLLVIVDLAIDGRRFHAALTPFATDRERLRGLRVRIRARTGAG